MRLISTFSENASETYVAEIIDMSDPLTSYTVYSLATILAVFTILSNLCTILLLVRYRPMQKSISNLYVLSLSMADMLIGVLLLTVILIQFVNKSFFTHFPMFCDLWQMSDIILSTISLYSICSIALDRVWNLEKPLRIFKRSRRLARKLIVCIWFLPVAVWLLYYFIVTDRSHTDTVFGMDYCTVSYSRIALVPIASAIFLYIPSVGLIAMFIRISVVVHNHLSFLRVHSNNPIGTPANQSSRSREGTPHSSRTPEPAKRMSDGSVTSGYGSMKTPHSPSFRFQRAVFELAPLSEERSSGRERSFSEQLPKKIEHFEVDSTNHLRVKNTTSNPTRRESVRKNMHFTFRSEVQPKRDSFTRSSFRRLSSLGRTSSCRFSVIAIPANLSDLLQREGVSQQVRAAKAVALILFCFLLCWLPFLIIWPLKMFCRSCVPDSVYLLSIGFNYLCSALNPLLYTLSSPRVRVIFLSYFSFCFLGGGRVFKNQNSFYAKSGTMV